MTTLEIILDPRALASVTGGAERGQSREQIQARTQNLCRIPDPQTARAQYETMLEQMTPDSSEAPGIKRRAVKSIAALCHWPFPG